MSQTMPISDHLQVASPKSSRAEDYALQKVQITSFIRHILEQYRFGFQILAEFIQNADDAKAHAIDIGVDERSHSAKSLPGEATSELMGPALTVYNNETFSDQDFQNITNTGDSSKRKDASKTGRFCLGINTAFHLGDCILLVTGSRMVAFDPTRRFFPDPLLVEFGTNNHQFADEFPDFCKPFLAYGITFREHYQGTLFRIPLRKHAPPGSLSRQIYSAQELWTELLDDFCEQVAPCLLFLRSVQSISVHSIEADGNRKEICRAEVEAEKSQEFLANRTKIFLQLLGRNGSEKPKVAEFQARCRGIRDSGELPKQVQWVHLKSWRCSRLSKKRTVVESSSSWLLSTSVAGGGALKVAIEEPEALEERRVPLVQVAACMELGGVPLPRIEGRAHVALPLLDEPFHGMHTNLFADTTPDRRKLLRSQERHVTAWLHALMQDGCAVAASDMVERIAGILAPDFVASVLQGAEEEEQLEAQAPDDDSSNSDSDGSWEAVGPRRQAGAGGGRKEAEHPPWYALFAILDDTTQDSVTQVLHRRLYQALWDAEVLMGAGQEGAGLCKPSEAVYVDAQKVPSHVEEVLGEVMRLAGARRLVHPTERMIRGFRAAGVPLEVATPQMVVSALHGPTPQLAEYLTRNAGAHVACLGYILRDSKASRRLPGASAVLSLDGKLQVLPGPCQAAWMSSDSGNSSESEDERAAAAGRGQEELYIASEEQKELFGGAAGPLGSTVLAMREDLLQRRLLTRLTRCCGVQSLSRCAAALCKVIPRLLPAHWLRQPAVHIGLELGPPSSPQQRQQPPTPGEWVSLARVGALWRHLSTFADLSAQHLNGVGPILPTSCGKLVALEGTAWFDRADLAFLSAEEVELLVEGGVLLVDCELHCIARQVRKLKCPAAALVEQISGAMTAPRSPASCPEKAALVLSILGKLHARTRLSPEQLERVRGWPILEVEEADGQRRQVSLQERGPLHDCSAAVDRRLVRGAPFLVPQERGKEVMALLRAAGVVWVEEPELYQRFLLPSLSSGLSMLRDEGVLCDFLAETLPRLDGSSSMAGFVDSLREQPLLPSEDPAAPLLRPADARDPTDAHCRTLFAARRFPSLRLQERRSAMLMLARMGLCAAATAADLEAVFPRRWADRELVDDWAPGVDGEPTVAQVHAAWMLCGDDLRGAAWAATSTGRLVRGRHCQDALPLYLPREWSEGFARRLGLETLLTDPATDFALRQPPGGYLPVTPESLLALLSKKERAGADEMKALTSADKDLLREFLMRHLGSRAVVVASSPKVADSGAVVSIEERLLARAVGMRQICQLPIHKEVAWDEQTGAVQVRYSRMVSGRLPRARSGGERLRGADEDVEAPGSAEVLAFHAEWVLLRESVWRGKAQLPAGTLGLSGRRFVCYEEVSGWFYREMGVQEVCSVSELYAELVMRGKGLADLPTEEQQRHVAFIRDRRLLDGSEMGKALALPLRNVPVQADEEGVMRKASELVDCRVPELSTIFSSKAGIGKSGPWLLPPAVAKDKGVVAFLEQLGLRRGVEDFDFLVTCARALARIASGWSHERGGTAGAKTGRGGSVSESQLVEAGLFLFDALGQFKDHDSMLAQVGRIAFVPLFLSKRVYSFRPPGGNPLAAVKDLAPPSLSNVHCLVRPTLHSDIETVPKAIQNLLWPHGDLDHDSEIVFTIKQLRRLAELIGDYDNSTPAAERAPKKHLKELEELVYECYSSMDEVVKKKDALLNNLSLVHDELLKFPCVYLQTAQTFVRASQVFSAVPSSVSGLVFALDSRLHTWPALVEELRIKERPSRLQWLTMLKSLMDREPSPAVAASCVELLQIVARDSELMSNVAFLNELVAPDSGNALRPLHEVLVNDAPWLLPRIAPSSHIHIVHRKLGANPQLARTLRLRALSEAVEEQAEAGAEGGAEEGEVGDHVPAARLLRDLRGREVVGGGSPLRHRLLWLLDQQLSEPALLGDEAAADEGARARVDGARVCELLEALPARLLQVEKIASRFELLQAQTVPPVPAGEWGGQERERWRRGLARRDVTNAATRTDSMLLHSRGRDVVHVASWLLRVPSVLQSKLADALNRALDGVLSERWERVLSSLLACESEREMDATLTQLQLHSADDHQHSAADSPARGLAPVPMELLATGECQYAAGAPLSRKARQVLTPEAPPQGALRAGDLVAVSAGVGESGDGLVLAEVLAVYRFLGAATVRVGAEVQRVVVVGRDVWWFRDGGEGGQGGEEAGEEGASDDESVEEACEEGGEQEVEEAGEEEEAAAAPAEEEEESPSRLDASAKLKEIRDEIESHKGRLEEEKARKLKVYERQVQAEFKDGMKRVLKRLLLRWHPDKLRSQAQEAGVQAEGSSAEQMEEYLKDIAQELNRIMHQYTQE